MGRLFNKKKFVFVFGLLIGVIIMGGASYALNEIQSSSVSYKKKDGTITTVKQALDDLINTSLSRIDELDEKVTDYEKGIHYLADVVKVGEYVAYDAGEWNETKEKPKSQGEFGGYTDGQSKNDSVEWCYSNSHTTSLKGWRVLSKNETTKTVTIIHAGQPECYYHGTNPTESITKLNDRAKNQYLNQIYAESAHAMNYGDAYAITGDGGATSETLRNTGSLYWLTNSGYPTGLYYVWYDGSIHSDETNSFGFRPVIELKAKILTTGQGSDKVGNNKAWQLVKPQ